MIKSMNKVVSLPRISTHHPQTSKSLASKSRKNSVDSHQMSIIDSVRDKKNENDEQNKVINKKNIPPMKRVRSQFLKRSNSQNQELQKQKKYGLKQNGKLSKIQQVVSVVRTLNTQRSNTTSKPQSQNKQKINLLKKELNEVASSILILKKQIKAIQGGTLQLKQQTKNFVTAQNANQAHSKVQQKIEQVKKKKQWSRYDQQILKNMKDRLKNILIYYDKKTSDLKQNLQRQQKKVKILNQRTSVREQSINKKKQLIKKIQQKQKISNRLIQMQVQDYQKKIKQHNFKQLIGKTFKLINSDQYHYEVYKKEQGRLFDQLRVNYFVRNLLDCKWNQYSEQYAEVQKAQKLMQMHVIQKTQQQFNPFKIYFESFNNKNQLQKRIKQNQLRLTQSTKRNNQLKKIWQNIQFKQSQQTQNQLNKKSMQIKTGKIKQQFVIQKQQRQQNAQIRRKKQTAKEKSETYSQIKQWITKLQKTINITINNSITPQQKLQQIIRRTLKTYRKKKDSINKVKA